METASSDRDPVEALAEEFLERKRRGEKPTLDEYVERHPDLADEIRDLFPALVMIEDFKPAADSAGGPSSGESGPRPLALEQLGDYRIIREVGRGGMGIVYEAEQVSLGRHVALKVLPQQLLLDARHRHRFEREARAAARLHHTNIVPVFGVGQADGLHYYVMQFIQGLGLDAVLDELKRMRTERGGGPSAAASAGELRVTPRDISAQDVARSLLSGGFERTVDFASADASEKPIHGVGDPTPSAEQVDPTDTSKLTSSAAVPAPRRGTHPVGRLRASENLSDSSLILGGQSDESGGAKAKKQTYWQSVARIGAQVASALDYAHGQGVLHRDVKPSNLLLDTRGTVWVADFGLAKTDDQRDLTHTGDIVGTLRYMPPEAFQGKTDRRGDVYSLGLTLYELLAFEPAFDECDKHRLIKQLTDGDPPRLEKRNAEVPRDLVTIVQKAIDRDPARRYSTAGELEADLQRFLDDEPIRARRISPLERLSRWTRHHKGLAASLASMVLLLIAVSVVSGLAAIEFHRLAGEKDAVAGRALAAEREAEAARRHEADLRRQADTARQVAEEGVEREALLRRQAQEGEHRETELRQQAESAYELSRRSVYATSIFAAQRAIDTGANARANELLAELRPPWGEKDLRGWEWYYLDSRTNSDASVLRGFGGAIHAVAFSPNGQWLATGDRARLVRIWNAATGRCVTSLVGHEATVNTLAWDPRGRGLASGADDGTIRVWESETWRAQLAFKAHSQPITSVAWSHDGRQIASASRDATAKTWDSQTGRQLQTFRGHTAALRSVGWHPDATRMITGSEDKTVRLWDAQSGTQVRFLSDGSKLAAAAFSPDGARFAVAMSRGDPDGRRVRIFDTETGGELGSLDGADHDALFVVWGPDGTRLAATGGDGTATVWDTRTFQGRIDTISDERRRVALDRELRGHSGGISSCSFSPDGRRLATSGHDATVRLWDLAKSDAPQLAGHEGTVWALAWSRDGSQIASTGADGLIKVWDARTLSERLSIAATSHSEGKRAIDFSPDGSQLLSSSKDGTIRIWDAASGEELRRIDGYEGREVTFAAWSPDGSRIVSAGIGPDIETIKLWNAATGERIGSARGRSVSFVAWSPDASRIAGCTYMGWIGVWDVATTKLAFAFDRPGEELWSAAFSPDGRRLAAAGGDRESGSVTVWDLDSRQEVFSKRGHTLTATSVEYSADGSRLLSASADGTFKIWDAQSGQEILTLEGPDLKVVHSARFSPNGTRLAAAGFGGFIRLWDATGSFTRDLSPKLLPALDRGITAQPTFNELKLRGEISAQQGRWDEAAADFDQAARLRPASADEADWFETTWWVVGPCTGELREACPPESEADPFRPVASVGTAASVVSATGTAAERPTESKKLVWQPVRLGKDNSLNLARLFHRAELVSAYVLARVYCPAERPLGVLLGSDDQVRLWLNGKLVHENLSLRPAVPDQDAVPVVLKRGWNTLLAKVRNERSDWALFLRLSDDPVELALAYERNRLWAPALDQWNRAIAERPDDVALLLAGGRAAASAGSDELAGERFDKAIELEATSVDVWIARGTAAAERGEWDRAAADYARAFELGPPADPALWYEQAYLRLKAGDEAGYRQLCARMLKLYDETNNMDDLFFLAHCCVLAPHALDDDEGARRLALMMLPQVQPRGISAIYWSAHVNGLAMCRSGNYEMAVNFLGNVLQGHLGNAGFGYGEWDHQVMNWLTLAIAHARLNHPGTAQVWLDKSTQWLDEKAASQPQTVRRFAPEGWLWRDWLGAQMLRHEGQDAIAQAWAVEPADAAGWVQRGNYHFELGQWERAIDAFGQGLTPESTDTAAFRHRAEAHVWLRRWDEAAADVAKALSLTPHLASSQWDEAPLAVVDMAARSDELFEAVSRSCPDDDRVWIARAWHLGRAGRFSDMVAPMMRVVELDPSDHLGWYYLSVVQIETGDLAGYRRTCREMLDRFRETNDAYIAERTAKTCLLVPGAVDDLRLPVKLADFALAHSADNWVQWFHLAKGLAEYRGGNFAAAIEQLDASFSPGSENLYRDGAAWAVLAMARRRLKQTAEAEHALAKSRELLKRLPALESGDLGDGWPDVLRCYILLREAEAMLDDKTRSNR